MVPVRYQLLFSRCFRNVFAMCSTILLPHLFRCCFMARSQRFLIVSNVFPKCLHVIHNVCILFPSCLHCFHSVSVVLPRCSHNFYASCSTCFRRVSILVFTAFSQCSHSISKLFSWRFRSWSSVFANCFHFGVAVFHGFA